jgi:N-acetylmuramoyl-L-alanine amidase
MKMCVDAGHGGADPGAIGDSPSRLEEKAFTLALAALLEAELESRGHWVTLTRREDRTLELEARAAFANRLEADIFVSIHANSAVDADAEGMEVYHHPGSSIGHRLGQNVLAAMLAAFPDHRNRGVKSANFAVLRRTRMPAILVECEFLSNPRQLRFLADPASRRRLAAAIATGIIATIPASQAEILV